MPVHETKGGYKYGETGKTYKDKKSAIKQAIAIAYSKAKEKGRKPTQQEIKTEISGSPAEIDKAANAMNDYNAYGLRKAASIDYSTYGLQKVAEGVYGTSLELARKDPNSYISQTDRLYKERVGQPDSGTAYRVGWNPFVRSKSVRWAPAYYLKRLFGAADALRPGERVTWNPLENFGATWWHPKRFLGLGSDELTQEEGDYIRDQRVRELAQRYAGTNQELYNTLYDDFSKRSEVTRDFYNRIGMIRPDLFSDPLERKPKAEPQPEREAPKFQRGNRLRISTRRGVPDDDWERATYWSDEPATAKNWNYDPDSTALDWYRSLDKDKRTKVNEETVAF